MHSWSVIGVVPCLGFAIQNEPPKTPQQKSFPASLGSPSLKSSQHLHQRWVARLRGHAVGGPFGERRTVRKGLGVEELHGYRPGGTWAEKNPGAKNLVPLLFHQMDVSNFAQKMEIYKPFFNTKFVTGLSNLIKFVTSYGFQSSFSHSESYQKLLSCFTKKSHPKGCQFF